MTKFNWIYQAILLAALTSSCVFQPQDRRTRSQSQLEMEAARGGNHKPKPTPSPSPEASPPPAPTTTTTTQPIVTTTTTTIPAPTPTPTAGVVLFQEGFENSSFSTRGWYDSTGGALSTTEKFAGLSSLQCRFLAGATGCSGGNPSRIVFQASDSVYLSFYIKHNSSWVGNGLSYPPHLIHFLTNLEGPYAGPAYTHLTTYVEEPFGAPRLYMQDGMNIDENRIGQNLVGVTEQRAVSGCNGDSDGTGSTTCFLVAPGEHWNGKWWENTQARMGNGQWYLVEAYFKLNSIVNGIGVKDGAVQYWLNGNLIVNQPNVVLRTGQHPTMKFNQFMLAPFMGDGSPADQTFWMDNLMIATARPAVPPVPPGSGGVPTTTTTLPQVTTTTTTQPPVTTTTTIPSPTSGITLFSTTYNCADWLTYSDPLNCDGLKKNGAWTTSSGHEEQILLAANYSGGLGGKGQRHWIGNSSGNTNGSGGTFIEHGRQQEVYVRFYTRWQAGLRLGGDSAPVARNEKVIYFSGGACGQAGGCYFDLQGSVLGFIINGDPHHVAGGWDQIFGGTDAPSDGRWIRMDFRIKNETAPGARNGIVQWWIDGVLKMSVTNVDMKGSTGFYGFELPSNHQFRTVDRAVDMYQDIDDVIVRTGPIP
jgi:hypothetical protein